VTPVTWTWRGETLGCEPHFQTDAVPPKRFRWLGVEDANRAEQQLRAGARQQEAVAHLGQQALAGTARADLLRTAAALLSRGLDVEFSEFLELKPEHRSLVLHAGEGWSQGAVGRTILPTEPGTFAAHVFTAAGPVVIEHLAEDIRFSPPEHLERHGVVSGVCVVVQGRERPWGIAGILGAYSARRRAFSAPDILFVEAIAHVLATAIERARVEDALRKSEEQFRSIIENASDIVTILGDDGIIRFTSPSVQRLLGYQSRDLLGRNAFEFIHPDDLNEVMEAIADAIASPGMPQQAEFRFRHTDGSWRVLESIGQAKQDAPHAYSVIVNSRDVTERVRQDAMLRTNKHRLRTVVAGAPVILFSLDADGVFTLVEGKGLESLGVRSGMLIGHSLFDLLGDVPDAVADARRALAGESFTTVVKLFGSEFEVQYSPVHEPDGTISGLVGVATDMTERRGLEEQLRQSQKMEAIGQLTGGIAHDFNNLLTIILANAEMLQKGHDAESVRDIMSAAISGRVMVNQLLGFARRSPLTFEPLHLGPLVTDLGAVLRRVFPDDIELLVLADEDLPEIGADGQAVEQIILNLVNNAKDAMPQGGTLRLETSCSWISDAQRQILGPDAAHEYVCLAVDDTGEGMDEATRERAFEPFFTTKDVGKGTGLGLATVYGLVKQHRGFVQIDSAPGAGTRVRVYFPVVEESKAST
jgi:PAS domain S-box-containing protein